MTAKHSIGATVTACSQEKKPNEMPAMLPNAKCGNRAVPPETGYMPPSSAWTSARMMTMTPAMTQASRAARAGRLRGEERAEEPAGADDRGLGRPGGADQAHFPFQADVGGYVLHVAPAASVLLAMLDPFSDRAPQGCHPRVGSSRYAGERCVCAK